MMDAITITIRNTPTGVLVHTDADLEADDPATQTATALLRFTDGLFEGGQPVRMSPEVVAQLL